MTVRSLGEALAALFKRTIPDPFVLAILLTLVTGILALTITEASFPEVIDAWQGPLRPAGPSWSGFFGLLSFGMQMCLVLVTGHALATAPLFNRLIRRLADIPPSGPAAAALVCFVSSSAGLVNWGLGLIIGATLARFAGQSLKERGKKVHYPTLCAAGYSAMLVWHGGLSGSAPLKVTTREGLEELLGVTVASSVAPVSTHDTLFGGLNLFVSGGLLVLAPLFYFLVSPTDGDRCSGIEDFSPPAEAPLSDDGSSRRSFVERLEESAWTTWVLAAPLFFFLAGYYAQYGLSRLDPNAINLTLFALGLALHRSPRAYVEAARAAVPGCSGILLQFPIYGGIMGIMAGTGLAALFASLATASGSQLGFMSLTFGMAGVINFFVPSGGGQWAVQGPIAVDAALNLGVPLQHAVMAVAYGDQWSNMLQPFWALPLLGLTGVKARDVMGYTAMLMVFAGVWIFSGFLLFTS